MKLQNKLKLFLFGYIIFIINTTYTQSPLKFTALELSENNLYLGTDNGLYQSTFGYDWKKTNFPPSCGMITDIKANGKQVFASTKFCGLHQSNDGGMNWENSTLKLSSLTYINCLLVFENTILVGTDNKGIFISNDAGKTWKSSNNGLKSDKIFAIIKVADKVYLGTKKGLYFSNDQGENWVVTTSELKSATIKTLDFDKNSNTILAGSNSWNVDFYENDLKSDNWTKIGTTIKANSIFSAIRLKNKIYVGTNISGIMASEDKGNTWFENNSGANKGNEIYKFITKNDSIYVGTEKGLYFSTRDNNSWKQLRNTSSPSNKPYQLIGEEKNTKLYIKQVENNLGLKLENNESTYVTYNIIVTLKCKSSTPFGGVSYEEIDRKKRISLPGNSSTNFEDNEGKCIIEGCFGNKLESFKLKSIQVSFEN
jgi:photosystem II stability/assembly factor-like uncharacterized protein